MQGAASHSHAISCPCSCCSADLACTAACHVCPGRSRMLSGVEAGLNTAMERLPENVAEKVKGRFINRCEDDDKGCCGCGRQGAVLLLYRCGSPAVLCGVCLSLLVPALLSSPTSRKAAKGPVDGLHTQHTDCCAVPVPVPVSTPFHADTAHAGSSLVHSAQRCSPSDN